VLLEAVPLSKKMELTGFSGGGGEGVAAAIEGISFPLEREEAVESWAAGATARAEAFEATGVDWLELAFGLLQMRLYEALVTKNI
jgi:hypothetical protein